MMLLAQCALPLAAGMSEGGYTTGEVLGLLAGLVAIVLFIGILRLYKRCPSNKILVIYGKTGRGAAKCVHGGAAFVWPLFQASSFLDLEPFVVPIDLTSALSQENIRVSVPTTVTAAISNEPGIMENAAIRLLGLTREQIQSQAQDIILGQMRAVIATMKIDDINRDRQAFMAKVNEAVAVELEKIGLAVINVNIKDIEDESGYLKAMGRKAAAEAINQANDRRVRAGAARQDRRGRAAARPAQGRGRRQRRRRHRRTDRPPATSASRSPTSTPRPSRPRPRPTPSKAALPRQPEGGRGRGPQPRPSRPPRSADGADPRGRAEGPARRPKRPGPCARQSRLKAEVVVPAEAARKQVVIQSDAEKQLKTLVAEGEANAILVKMKAEAEGTQAVLDAKAAGYGDLDQGRRPGPAGRHDACSSSRN